MKSRPRTAVPKLNTVKTNYQNIIRQVIDAKYLPSALEWVQKINDKEKQGLKIISAVVKHRGNK